MHVDFATMTGPERYRLMASAITPRPIAWITSQSAAGLRNAAPFSFFNMMGADPPLLAVGLMRRGDGTLKDTAANILATGEFVVHLVSEPMVAAMNLTCIDAPADVDEIELAGLATVPSLAVAPPRLVGAPVAMECRLAHHWDTAGSTVVLGEVLHFHCDDAYWDAQLRRIDTPAMHLVGRVHGGGWYARGTDLFSLDRPTWPLPAAPEKDDGSA